jgi:hypothetical protein
MRVEGSGKHNTHAHVEYLWRHVGRFEIWMAQPIVVLDDAANSALNIQDLFHIHGPRGYRLERRYGYNESMVLLTQRQIRIHCTKIGTKNVDLYSLPGCSQLLRQCKCCPSPEPARGGEAPSGTIAVRIASSSATAGSIPAAYFYSYVHEATIPYTIILSGTDL